MSRATRIRTALEQAFAPVELEVEDESEAHRGHAGYQDGGESHFRVRMRAAAMAGQSRIARHRAVHAAIGPDLMGEIHALALDLDAP
ncbi:BolA family protein [Pseudaestuariivita atlantica]|uniref:BolA family transcriptional regulator n=1 Tax=Pseudaestuariivita atlantica TaxID=1317121 RepID=A0A0L1JUJ6_9RHOB|nr:BolA family protein [Pseudaestuariivita atlantica]KNG95083.1 BolA family transcriptional regulator [Pseudaestuariivita atlantica]